MKVESAQRLQANTLQQRLVMSRRAGSEEQITIILYFSFLRTNVASEPPPTPRYVPSRPVRPGSERGAARRLGVFQPRFKLFHGSFNDTRNFARRKNAPRRGSAAPAAARHPKCRVRGAPRLFLLAFTDGTRVENLENSGVRSWKNKRRAELLLEWGEASGAQLKWFLKSLQVAGRTGAAQSISG